MRSADANCTLWVGIRRRLLLLKSAVENLRQERIIPRSIVRICTAEDLCYRACATVSRGTYTADSAYNFARRADGS